MDRFRCPQGRKRLSLAYTDAATTTVTGAVPDPALGTLRLRGVTLTGNSSPRGGRTCGETISTVVSLGRNRADDRTCHLTKPGDRER